MNHKFKTGDIDLTGLLQSFELEYKTSLVTADERAPSALLLPEMGLSNTLIFTLREYVAINGWSDITHIYISTHKKYWFDWSADIVAVVKNEPVQSGKTYSVLCSDIRVTLAGRTEWPARFLRWIYRRELFKKSTQKMVVDIPRI